MKKLVAIGACAVVMLGTTMNAISHVKQSESKQGMIQSTAANEVGGSKFWAGLACGGAVGFAVFAAPTIVGTGAAVVIAIGTCGDAFFG